MGYSHGKRWSAKDIEDGVMQIVRDRGMTTFPTIGEMEEYYGNSMLSNRVSKTGGSRVWADRLGLPIKKSDTNFGHKYELYAMGDIFNKTPQHMESEKMTSRFPYDLLVEKCVKVDVKVSRLLTYGGRTPFHSFNLEKRSPTCDIFLLYALDENEEVRETFIVPSSIVCGVTQIYIGVWKNFDAFLNRWDILSEYLDFHKAINAKYGEGFRSEGQRQ